MLLFYELSFIKFYCFLQQQQYLDAGSFALELLSLPANKIMCSVGYTVSVGLSRCCYGNF